MNRKLLLLIATLIELSGCASGPTLSELRKDATTATFVQHGREPANMGLGVVDTASWWAANGGSVASSTGGLAWYSVAAAAQTVKDKRAPTSAEIIEYLYNGHPMADQAVAGVMPDFARAWGVPYDQKNQRFIARGTSLEDKDGYLTAFAPTTDLVLVAWLASVQLTEKITMGAAFKAGFTLGTGTKDVTAQTILGFRAYRREVATGRYKNVWTFPCQLTNMDMETAYPFPELVVSRDKAKTLWDEATPRMIKKCNSVLQYLGKEG